MYSLAILTRTWIMVVWSDTWPCIGREGDSLSHWLGHRRQSHKLVIIFTIGIVISQAALKAFHNRMPPWWGVYLISKDIHIIESYPYVFNYIDYHDSLVMMLFNCIKLIRSGSYLQKQRWLLGLTRLELRCLGMEITSWASKATLSTPKTSFYTLLIVLLRAILSWYICSSSSCLV